MPDISVHHGRAEGVISEVPELLGKFDVALSRAVGLDARLIVIAMAYLRIGGRLVASGPPVGSPMPKIKWQGPAEWKTVEFPKISLARTFLMATKLD